jgi:hypothetical protein
MIFKVYICQGPEKHCSDSALSLTTLAGLNCRLCDSPVDEVEVVRVDELLSDEAIERVVHELAYGEKGFTPARIQAQNLIRADLNR